ncbi:NAD-dependent protein deacylase [Paenibacillus sp. GCM10027627]|uniref:NAD-dependent protein deacylase n=1 Tax=unclassified Paenibacillus TaxID=185978 RepID=UPI003624E657
MSELRPNEVELARKLQEAQSITVFTGAGISTASGIPDFRSRGGLYDLELPVERIVAESFFYQKPKLFWTHFKSIFHFQNIGNYKPNDGHIFLRELEQAGKQVTIVTQNVDGLHRRAGSGHVLEVHGTLQTAHCPKCRRTYEFEHLIKEEIPRCEQDDFILKPDVVLFEGSVKHLEEAFAAAAHADLFLALGTSLNVYPVKELPRYAKGGLGKAIINREPTDMDGLFDAVIHDDIVDVFSRIRRFVL